MPQAQESTSKGRKLHLGQLAFVFYHRGGTWRDFGQFLKALFGEMPDHDWAGADSCSKPAAPTGLRCRHSNLHNISDWATVKTDLAKSTVFNHERYDRPCLGTGSYERGKNPGLVVHDLCGKAKGFLESIGKGEKIRPLAGEDYEGDHVNESTQQQNLEFISSPPRAVSKRPLKDESPEVSVKRRRRPVVESSDDEEVGYEDTDFWDDSEACEIINRLADTVAGAAGHIEASDLWSSVTIEPPSDVRGSDDSVLFRERSTKMRTATLGYLWQFADNPTSLRLEYQRLRAEPSLQVLHLCGCGLCCEVDGVRLLGCSEKTHLKLGTAAENKEHTHYHSVLKHTRLDNGTYVVQCKLIHEHYPDGMGIF